MEQEGRYLAARYELTVRLGMLPTVQEIADHMGVGARTVEAIRDRTRTWQRETTDSLGWDPASDLHSLDGAVSERARILGAYVLGELTTRQAARRLALSGLPADERELRRWKAMHQPPE